MARVWQATAGRHFVGLDGRILATRTLPEGDPAMEHPINRCNGVLVNVPDDEAPSRDPHDSAGDFEPLPAWDEEVDG